MLVRDEDVFAALILVIVLETFAIIWLFNQLNERTVEVESPKAGSMADKKTSTSVASLIQKTTPDLQKTLEDDSSASETTPSIDETTAPTQDTEGPANAPPATNTPHYLFPDEILWNIFTHYVHITKFKGWTRLLLLSHRIHTALITSTLLIRRTLPPTYGGVFPTIQNLLPVEYERFKTSLIEIFGQYKPELQAQWLTKDFLITCYEMGDTEVFEDMTRIGGYTAKEVKNCVDHCKKRAK
ncbi:hypothetical protein HDV00_007366 [Rhizophlyctis rosea]|nr:hypothetical protein HDV00_007366 [Rhizophlyctis rosea]